MLNKKSGQIAETKNWKFLSTSIMPISRSGQIAETITWLVATTIIIVVLLISISVVSFQSKDRKFVTEKKDDLLVTKSFMAYMLSSDTPVSRNIFSQVKDKVGSPSDKLAGLEVSNVDLAKKIFPVLYSNGEIKNYFWTGVVEPNYKFQVGKGLSVFNRHFEGNRADVKALALEPVIYQSIKLDKAIFELLVKIKK